MTALAACSSAPDPALAGLRDTAPRAGMARIVVFTPPYIIGGDILSVELNGVASCGLRPGTFLVREVEPGEEHLKFSFCSMAATPPYSVTAVAGKTYYIRVTPYDSSMTGILSGYPHENGPYDAKPHTGTFEVTFLKEPEALAELAKLKKVQDQ
jgi:hypothetical protein